MKRFFHILSLVAAVALLSGCSLKEEWLVQNHYMMGNIVEGRFLSDEGVWYDVLEQECDGDLRTENRAFVLCDILKNLSTTEEVAYGIRLKKYYPASVALVKEGGKEELELPYDPVAVDYAWPSGIYLNLLVYYAKTADSEIEHKIWVAVEEKPGEGDPVVLRIYHDAGGEYPGAEGYESKSFVAESCYISVPLSTYYVSGNHYTFDYIVKFPWFKADSSGSLTSTVEEQSVSGNLYH